MEIQPYGRSLESLYHIDEFRARHVEILSQLPIASIQRLPGVSRPLFGQKQTEDCKPNHDQFNQYKAQTGPAIH